MRKAVTSIAALALAALALAAGCGQPDLSKVDIDNPVLDEAWVRFAEAETAGVSGMQLDRVKQDLLKQEENLKKYYLDTGESRNEGIELIIAGLTEELQKYLDDITIASEGLNRAEQQEAFARIRDALLPNLGPGQYIYAMALSTADPTWALAWLDENTRDFQVEGPAFALRLNQDGWTINYAGQDVSAFPGLPRGLADTSEAYTWLSDTAWVVTQTEDYAEAARPGQPYSLERFDYDDTLTFAYVYLKFAPDTMGFRYQKAMQLGWALIEAYTYPPETAQAAGVR